LWTDLLSFPHLSWFLFFEDYKVGCQSSLQEMKIPDTVSDQLKSTQGVLQDFVSGEIR
jgi:hypothetical protein